MSKNTIKTNEFSLYLFSVDFDCDFERARPPTCGLTNEGWQREFSLDVPNGRRGKLKILYEREQSFLWFN